MLCRNLLLIIISYCFFFVWIIIIISRISLWSYISIFTFVYVGLNVTVLFFFINEGSLCCNYYRSFTSFIEQYVMISCWRHYVGRLYNLQNNERPCSLVLACVSIYLSISLALSLSLSLYIYVCVSKCFDCFLSMGLRVTSIVRRAVDDDVLRWREWAHKRRDDT